MVPAQFILKVDMACFSQTFNCKVKIISKSSGKQKDPFFQGGEKLIKAHILKFQFVSFLPVYSRGHFKVVSMNSEVRFSRPDPYQRILLIQKELLDLEEDDILVKILLQVEIFSLSFIGGNLCQKL